MVCYIVSDTWGGSRRAFCIVSDTWGGSSWVLCIVSDTGVDLVGNFVVTHGVDLDQRFV